MELPARARTRGGIRIEQAREGSLRATVSVARGVQPQDIMTLSLRGVLATWLATMAGLLSPAAHADCEDPAAEVLWSYPKHGAENIPIDVQVRILPQPAQLELDGRVLEIAPDLSFDPGLLEPATRHSLRVTHYTGESEVLEFSTGAQSSTGETEPPLEIRALESTLEEGFSFDGMCGQVLLLQGCPDTDGFQIFTALLETESNAAPAYVIRAPYDGGEEVFLWPRECGNPQHLTIASGRHCLSVQAAGAAGPLASETEACTGDHANGAAGAAGPLASETEASADGSANGAAGAAGPLASETEASADGSANGAGGCSLSRAHGDFSLAGVWACLVLLGIRRTAKGTLARAFWK